MCHLPNTWVRLCLLYDSSHVFFLTLDNYAITTIKNITTILQPTILPAV